MRIPIRDRTANLAYSPSKSAQTLVMIAPTVRYATRLLAPAKRAPADGVLHGLHTSQTLRHLWKHQKSPINVVSMTTSRCPEPVVLGDHAADAIRKLIAHTDENPEGNATE